MTTETGNRNDPLDLASYYATRTIMLAVVAFVGVILTTILAWGSILIATLDDDPGFPDWVIFAVGFFGTLGFIWFVLFLAQSLNALRHHRRHHHGIPTR
jgi:hypothetical protein